MKTNINITIDEDILEEVRKRNINISGTINNLLFKFLGPKQADPEEDRKIQGFLDFIQTLEIKMTFEEAQYIKMTLDKALVETWKFYKEKFKPGYDAFVWAKIRKKIRVFVEGENDKGEEKNE